MLFTTHCNHHPTFLVIIIQSVIIIIVLIWSVIIIIVIYIADDKNHWKWLTVGQKLFIHANITKMVQEEEASLCKACHYLNIKSQYHYWMSMLEEWSHIEKVFFWKWKTKMVKMKKNASHLDIIEDALLQYMFLVRGTLPSITIWTICLQESKLDRCFKCKAMQAQVRKSVQYQKWNFPLRLIVSFHFCICIHPDKHHPMIHKETWMVPSDGDSYHTTGSPRNNKESTCFYA